MLGAAIIGEVIALDDELPKKLNNPHPRSKELADEPCLHQPRTNATFCLVLDVLGNGREVGQLVDNVVNDVNHILVGVVMVVVHHAGGGGNGGRGTGGGCGGWLVPFLWQRKLCQRSPLAKSPPAGRNSQSAHMMCTQKDMKIGEDHPPMILSYGWWVGTSRHPPPPL